MFCHINERRFSDFCTVLDTAAMRDFIPYMGALELTFRCNQACCHCYCNLGANDSRKKDELTTLEIKRILDEMAQAGCLWLILTGGEILLREDFAEIYQYAVQKGMFVSVFTNATLLDDKTATLFAEFPPLGVEISIYGSSATLHDAVTGVPGSFQRTLEGIERLKKHKVRFTLKSILMSLNYTDLHRMQEFAQSLGARFYFDTLISARIDGGRTPLNYRLDVEKMVGFELDEEKDFEDCEDVFNNYWNKPLSGTLHCGAGVFAFNINPYGALSPCTMFSSFQYPLRKFSFSDAWKRLAKEYGEKQNDFLPVECRSCTMLLMCQRCAAEAEAETGSVNKKVEYLCALAKSLEKRFLKEKEEGRYEKETISEARD